MIPQALKSIEYLEEDALRPMEEADPGGPGRWTEEPSHWGELADFMEQVGAPLSSLCAVEKNQHLRDLLLIHLKTSF